MRKSLPTILVTLAVGAATASPAIAAPSPTLSQTQPGQPGAQLGGGGTTCGSPGATSQPPGLLTPAFAAAALKYAGSGAPSLNGNQNRAISQYDVACFEFTTNGH